MRMANLKCKFELFCDPEWKVSRPKFHETVNWCNYCKAPMAKLHSSSTVHVAFAWYFFENIFSKWCTFWSARECRHIFPQYICEQSCGVVVGVAMSQRFLGGVGFLTALGVGVGFFVWLRKSRSIIFYITLLNGEFLLKWYNFLCNFYWNREVLLCTTPHLRGWCKKKFSTVAFHLFLMMAWE